MLNFYRILLTFFNIIFFFFGISYILTSKDMKDNRGLKERPCPHDNPESYLWMGISVVVINLMGIFIACINSRLMEFIYKWLLAVAAAAFFLFIVFIVMIMPKKPGLAVFNDGVNGYMMQQYNPIVPLVLTNDREWNQIKGCYERNSLCDITRDQSNAEKDWIVDACCCIPPVRCNMSQASKATWKPGPTPGPDDPDCRVWMTTKGMTACYDCEQCKASYIASYKIYWEENQGNQITRLVTVAFMAALAWVAFYDTSEKAGDGQNHVRLAKSYLNP
ncbi:hypothetical protein M569_05463 [Genlisea aurea]|uniref:Uncharacterized protein n=1 Tax=Genlisea aurea TaxID=192259 RepID=S8E0U7_9LAMI|nr:hypothetical protein M569_05463 [Genlisea aurea]